MAQYKITRQHLLDTLTKTFEPLDFVQAFWEGGSAGFDRVDQWSDTDIQVIVEDDKVEETFLALEEALESLSEIELKFRLPEPTWHGHSQAFYRLKDASPFLMVDFVAMKAGNQESDRFMQWSTHGKPSILFDKTNAIVEEPINVEKTLETIKTSLERTKVTYKLFSNLALKEVYRGNGIEAMAFYQGYTLRPLLQVLRIKHCPVRHFYSTRYVHYDYPPDVVEKLEKLFYPKDAHDLGKKHAEAEAWFWAEVEDIDWKTVENKLG
jgi:hypothetical protein